MEVKRRRFTVHDYQRMGEAGILHEETLESDALPGPTPSVDEVLG